MISFLFLLSLLKIATTQTCTKSICDKFISGSRILLLNGIVQTTNWIDFQQSDDCTPYYQFQSVVVSISTMLWKNNASAIDYYLNNSGVSGRGFNLYQNFKINNSSSNNSAAYLNYIQASYLAFVNDSGIQFQTVYFADGVKTAHDGYYTMSWLKSSSILSMVNDSDYVLIPNYSKLSLYWTTDNKFMLYDRNFESGKFRLNLTFHNSCTIRDIITDVVIFKVSSVLATIQYTSLRIDIGQHDGFPQTKTIYRYEENQASNANFFASWNSGYIMSNFQFGYDITQPGLTMNHYQNNFMSFNKTIVVSASTTYDILAMLRMYRNVTNCPTTSFFDLSSQRCCNSCPTNTTSYSKVCKTCEEPFYYLDVDQFCKRCNLKFDNCKKCTIYGCYLCDAQYQLDNGVCKLCNASQIYNPVSSICQPCNVSFAGCTSCSSGACTACDQSQRYYLTAPSCTKCVSTNYLTATSCISCSAGIEGCNSCIDNKCQACDPQYYLTPFFTCNKCSLFANCMTCTPSACLSCNPSSHTVLVGGLCKSCNNDEFFDSATLTCKTCQGKYSNCVRCNNSECLECNASSMTQLQAGQCVACSTQEYFEPYNSSCVSCSVPMSNCKECSSSMICTRCDIFFQPSGYGCVGCSSLQYYDSYLELCFLCDQLFPDCVQCHQNACTQCGGGKVLIDGQCVNSIKITFNFSAFAETSTSNSIYAFLDFNDSVSYIATNYHISFFLQNTELSSSNAWFQDNNTLKATLSYDESLSEPILVVELVLEGTIDYLVKVTDSTKLLSIEHITVFQKELIETLSTITSSISQNSGSIFSSLSLTSLGGYFINILWSIQLASLYVFLPVTKPKVLELFLNATVQLQDIDILPFNIPNIYESSDLEVKGKDVFQFYQTDLYFMRSNFNTLIELLISIAFYSSLFFIFKGCTSNSFMMDLVRKQTVSKLFMNISMNLFNVMIPVALSATATLTSRYFSSFSLIYNYSVALIALILCFLIFATQIYCLHKFKSRDDQDIDDCFFGYKQERKYSQLQVMMYLFPQLLSTIMIPVFPPAFSLAILTFLQLANIVMQIKNPIMKVYVNLYIRIIHQFFYVVFNQVFVALYLIEIYYPQTQPQIRTQLGYIAIGTLGIILFLELTETVIEFVFDIIKCIKEIFHKNRIREMEKQLTDSNVVPERYRDTKSSNKLPNESEKQAFYSKQTRIRSLTEGLRHKHNIKTPKQKQKDSEKQNFSRTSQTQKESKIPRKFRTLQNNTHQLSKDTEDSFKNSNQIQTRTKDNNSHCSLQKYMNKTNQKLVNFREDSKDDWKDRKARLKNDASRYEIASFLYSKKTISNLRTNSNG